MTDKLLKWIWAATALMWMYVILLLIYVLVY